VPCSVSSRCCSSGDEDSNRSCCRITRPSTYLEHWIDVLLLFCFFCYRRLHAFIYQYSSAEEQRKDQRWRARCLSCRLVDPQTYDVPKRYLEGSQRSTGDVSSINQTYPSGDMFINQADGNDITASYPPGDMSINQADGNDITASYLTDDVSINQADGDDDVYITSTVATDDVSFSPAYSTDDVSFSPVDGNDDVGDASVYPADNVPINPVHPTSTADIHHSSDSVLGAIKITSSTPDLPGSDAMKPCPREICAASTSSNRFQRLFEYSDNQFGAAYARSSRVLSLLTTTSTPQEIILVLKLALNWLYRDALDASGASAAYLPAPIST